jgi:DNA-binding transcriptional LysR family regulator
MSRLTLAQLEAFFWTVRLGSAQRAAEHLHIAQPTISLRLKDLRDGVGTELLQRTASGLRVTQAGQAVMQHVGVVMGELQKIRGGAGDGEVAGSIRMGLAEGFAVTCLPPLQEALTARYPGLQPEWVINTNTFLEASLVQGALDLAVLVHPAGDEKLRIIPLGMQPTSWVVPSKWEMAGPVHPRDLWALPIFSNPPPSAMYRQVMGWFSAAGVEPVRISRCSSVSVIAEMVAGGIGAGVLPIPMVRRYVAEGTMRVVASTPPVEDGRVFAGYRVGMEDHRTRAVIRTLTDVLDDIAYLRRVD